MEKQQAFGPEPDDSRMPEDGDPLGPALSMEQLKAEHAELCSRLAESQQLALKELQDEQTVGLRCAEERGAAESEAASLRQEVRMQRDFAAQNAMRGMRPGSTANDALIARAKAEVAAECRAADTWRSEALMLNAEAEAAKQVADEEREARALVSGNGVTMEVLQRATACFGRDCKSLEEGARQSLELGRRAAAAEMQLYIGELEANVKEAEDDLLIHRDAEAAAKWTLRQKEISLANVEKELTSAKQKLAGPGQYQGSGEEVLAQLVDHEETLVGRERRARAVLLSEVASARDHLSDSEQTVAQLKEEQNCVDKLLDSSGHTSINAAGRERAKAHFLATMRHKWGAVLNETQSMKHSHQETLKNNAQLQKKVQAAEAELEARRAIKGLEELRDRTKQHLDRCRGRVEIVAQAGLLDAERRYVMHEETGLKAQRAAAEAVISVCRQPNGPRANGVVKLATPVSPTWLNCT